MLNIVKKGNEKYMKNMKIDANGTEIRVMGDVVNEDAYISLTDIAKYKNSDNAFIVVANWMRNHSTISFLGLWEQIHNPNFKPIEFDRFKAESGDNAFTLTPQQWIKATDAIGIVSKSGRYGGTYAHTDIAFEFASWISPEFKLYIIKDYQRLKKDEAERLAIGWAFIFNYSLSGLRRRRLIIRSRRHSTHASNITLIAASTASRIGWFASAYHTRSNHGR